MTSPRTLSPKAAKAWGVLYRSGIKFQTGREKDYQAALALLRERGMDSQDELKEASHWVGR